MSYRSTEKKSKLLCDWPSNPWINRKNIYIWHNAVPSRFFESPQYFKQYKMVVVDNKTEMNMPLIRTVGKTDRPSRTEGSLC